MRFTYFYVDFLIISQIFWTVLFSFEVMAILFQSQNFKFFILEQKTNSLNQSLNLKDLFQSRFQMKGTP